MTHLAANLAALARCNPGLADKLAAVEPAPSVAHLHSRIDPAREGEAFADECDIRYNALLVVLGFAGGWHVAALARKLAGNGLILVLEDLAVLKRALIDYDHSEALGMSNVVIFDGTETDGDLATVYRGGEGMFVIGVQVIDHLPSRARLADRSGPFLAMMERCSDAVRCNIATCKILARKDVLNRMGNLGAYLGLDRETSLAMSEAMIPFEAAIASAGGPA